MVFHPQGGAIDNVRGEIAWSSNVEAMLRGIEEQSATDAAWHIVMAASAMADAVEQQGSHERFGVDVVDGHARLRPVPVERQDVVIDWHPGSGWQSRLPPSDPRSALLDLYLPICGGTAAHPVTVG